VGCHRAVGGATARRGTRPVDLLVDFNVRAQPGLRVRRGAAHPTKCASGTACWVTSFLRTAYDHGQMGRAVDAVVAMDRVGGPGRVRARRGAGLRERYPRAWGSGRLTWSWALADPAAESAMETRLRLLLVLGGLPAPRVQYPVVRCRSVARAGRPGVPGYGRWPSSTTARANREAFQSDRRRDVEMAAGRLDGPLRVTSADVLGAPDRTLAQVRAVLARRAAGPA